MPRLVDVRRWAHQVARRAGNPEEAAVLLRDAMGAGRGPSGVARELVDEARCVRRFEAEGAEAIGEGVPGSVAASMREKRRAAVNWGFVP